MTLSSYTREQLAAAHRRDLLEAADQSRLIAQARQHRSERRRFRLPPAGLHRAVGPPSTRPDQLNRHLSPTFRGHHV